MKYKIFNTKTKETVFSGKEDEICEYLLFKRKATFGDLVVMEDGKPLASEFWVKPRIVKFRQPMIRDIINQAVSAGESNSYSETDIDDWTADIMWIFA